MIQFWERLILSNKCCSWLSFTWWYHRDWGKSSRWATAPTLLTNWRWSRACNCKTSDWIYSHAFTPVKMKPFKPLTTKVPQINIASKLTQAKVFESLQEGQRSKNVPFNLVITQSFGQSHDKYYEITMEIFIYELKCTWKIRRNTAPHFTNTTVSLQIQNKLMQRRCMNCTTTCRQSSRQ